VTNQYQPPPAGATMVTTSPQATPRRSQGRSLMLIVLVVLLLAGAFVGGLFTGKSSSSSGSQGADPAKAETFVWGAGGDIPEFEVSITGCSASPIEANRSFTSGADCEEPHDFQVFAADAPVSSSLEISYPGKEWLTQYGNSWCGLLFASSLITPDDKTSKWSYVTLIPSQDGWESTESGSKAVICVVRKRDRTQIDSSVMKKN
jgi:hypothetical protein